MAAIDHTVIVYKNGEYVKDPFVFDEDGGSRYLWHSWRGIPIGGEQRVVAPRKELALETGPSLFLF